MPKVFTIQDTGDALTKLFRKVGDLERMVTRPDVMGGSGGPGFGPDDTIDVGAIIIGHTGFKILLELHQDPIAGSLTLTPGAYLGDVFVDVSWVALDGATEYEIEMTKVLAPGVYSGVWTQQTGANNIRFRALEPNTTYGFRLYVVNHLGIRSTPVPATGYEEVTTGEDTTIPPAVTSVFIARGATSVIVKFSPLTKDQAPDVANGNGTYQIQISTDPTFSIVGQEQTTSATIVQFSDVTAEATYYARVRAIDSSGNASAWANSSPYTAGGVIDSMLVGDFSAAHITFGDMSGDRITANTLDVSKLTTSTLLATTITLGAGGQLFVNNPPTDGLVINSSGIRAYQGGTTTLWVDSSGNCYFTGAINGSTVTGGTIAGTSVTGGVITGALFRTASAGPRIELPSGTGTYVVNGMTFYTGFSGEVPVGLAGPKAPSVGAFQGSDGYNVGRGTDFPSEGDYPMLLLDSGSNDDGWFSASLSLGGSVDGSGVTGSVLFAKYVQIGAPENDDPSDAPIRMMRGIAGPGSDPSYTYSSKAAWIMGWEGHIHTFSWTGAGGACYRFWVDGTDVTANVKSFVIDHPADAKRHLVHACLEGPKADVYYRGEGVINGKEVEVSLPAYFEKLTTNDRTLDVFQVASEGGFTDPDVRLSWSRIANGKFIVRSDKANISFGYLVVAERKNTVFDTEPLKSEVNVLGVGPYTFAQKRKNKQQGQETKLIPLSKDQLKQLQQPRRA